MESGKKWSTLVDYFLILSAIVGVGFASGKEIYVFFYAYKGASIFGLVAFLLLYLYLFFIVQYVSKKLKLNSYDEFNQKMFGKLCKLSNVIMLINFSITSAGMLSGADYIFSNFFGIGFRVPSIIISFLAFFIVLGGIDRIKILANIILPIMIAVIVINGLKNINPQNVSMPITTSSSHMAIYFGLLFGVNNFVAALPVLFETKQNFKVKFFVIISICLIILLNIFILASNSFSTEMPLFELSANVSKSFYYIYFATIIFALFSTLIICEFNMQKILSKNSKSPFLCFVIILWNFILSNLGYNFVVKYLYVVSGICSGVFVVALIVMMIVNLIKLGKINHKV